MRAIFSDAKRITAIGFLALAVGFSSYYFFGSHDKPSAPAHVEQTSSTTTTQAKHNYVPTSDLSAHDVGLLVATINRRNAAFVKNPNPTTVDSFLSPSADDYQDEMKLLANLHDNKQHVNHPLLDLAGIQVSVHQQPFVTALIVASSQESDVVDANGKSVYQLGPSTTQQGYAVDFAWTDAGWRILSINNANFPDAQVKSILSGGLP